jgi:hypothetical protein
MTDAKRKQFHTKLAVPCVLQALLLEVQAAVQRAAHPVHKLRALGGMEALLALAGPRVQADAGTARYAVHILLQLLPLPELQPVACALLTQLLGQLMAAAAAEQRAPAAAKAGGKLQQQQQQQQQQDQDARQQQAQKLRAAALELVLPPAVSMLVQCADAKARRLQLSHRAPPGTAPSFAPAELADGDCLVQLLLLATAQAPQQLHHLLSVVEPLPDMPALAAARQLQQQMQMGECTRTQQAQALHIVVGSWPDGTRAGWAAQGRRVCGWGREGGRVCGWGREGRQAWGRALGLARGLGPWGVGARRRPQHSRRIQGCQWHSEPSPVPAAPLLGAPAQVSRSRESWLRLHSAPRPWPPPAAAARPWRWLPRWMRARRSSLPRRQRIGWRWWGRAVQAAGWRGLSHAPAGWYTPRWVAGGRAVIAAAAAGA